MPFEALALDAVIARACGAAVALILLLGAIDKLRDRELFEAIVENYRVLPAGAGARVLSLVLPAVEIVTAALLLWPAQRATGALAAIALMAIFSLAIAINLARGRRDVDCGCGGASGRQTLSWWLLVRNAALALLAAIGAVDGTARDMAWLDAFTAIAGTLALLALYVFFNQLGANAPRLQTLRRPAGGGLK
jgi:hypothetical protein